MKKTNPKTESDSSAVSRQSILEKLILRFRAASGIPELHNSAIRKILIIRQHNQFGDLLATTPLFRALKENLPNAEVNLLVSPANFYAVEKNRFISEQFIFDKRKMFSANYLRLLFQFLRQKYDLVIVPVTVAISSTSCILAGLSDAKVRVGPASLEGNVNSLRNLFHYQIPLSWSAEPESHVSEFGQKILAPLGISTTNLRANIDFDESDTAAVEKWMRDSAIARGSEIIGFHIGAGKPPNRWSVLNFAELIRRLTDYGDYHFVFTGTSADNEQIKKIQELISADYSLFLHKPVPQLSALISKCRLFVTNDTGVMHVAGTTEAHQVSIFGPTNPNNWAPVGANKIAVKNSDEIDSITVDEVYSECIKLLG